jgi:hypothetical protein
MINEWLAEKKMVVFDPRKLCDPKKAITTTKLLAKLK